MTHRIIVVDAASQDFANQAALQIDPSGGAQTFTQGLSPTGAAPATHYWCGWLLTPEEEALLASLLAQLPAGAWDATDSAGTTPDEILTALGLQRLIPAGGAP